jgi:hypothetical protein
VLGLFVDQEFDVRSLPVAPPEKAEITAREPVFSLPSILKPGRYSLYISVGNRTGTPKIALPLAGDDGQRRYRPRLPKQDYYFIADEVKPPQGARGYDRFKYRDGEIRADFPGREDIDVLVMHQPTDTS